MTVPCPDLRPFANSDPAAPERRWDPSFEQLVEVQRIDSTVGRVAAAFLGRARPEHRTATLGKLRCALAWHALAGFLAQESWRVAGSFGTRRGGDEIDAPELGRLDLGHELHLEYPRDLVLFLDGDERRVVLRFEVQLGPMGGGIEIAVAGSDDAPPFHERWFAHAARHSLLRGRNLRAGGRSAGPPGLRRDERLFVSAEVRERLDLVARRFDAQLARRLAGLGVRSRGGVILAGPPGTGKTSLCRELSGRLGSTFLWVTPGDLPSEDGVREVFELARWLAPTVVVLEDLDLVAESRLRGNRSSVLGQLMSELDGAPGDHAILTIATTNRLEAIEEAVRNRPGRFDQVIEIGPPDGALRRLLIEHRLAPCRVEAADLEWFADCLAGATGAEIEEAANGAIASAVVECDGDDEPPRIERRHLERSLGWVQRLPARREVGFAAAGE